ncbi:hypothetical protein FKM82_026429, partial [Ascaphus truei]
MDTNRALYSSDPSVLLSQLLRVHLGCYNWFGGSLTPGMPWCWQEPSGSTWRTSMELLQSYDLDVLKNDNVRLLTENEALTKRLGLMQENLELRCKLRDHECTVRSLTPSGKEHKEHNEPKAMDKKDEANVPPCRDPKQLKRCQRVVGEISLQLERRILVSIFLEPSRLYGYTVSNIQEKILQ